MKKFRIVKALIVFQIHYFKGKTEEKTQKNPPAARCDYYSLKIYAALFRNCLRLGVGRNIFGGSKIVCFRGPGGGEGRFFGSVKIVENSRI